MTIASSSGGNFLKQLRKQAGMRRREIEQISEIGENNLGKYESETRYPNRNTLKSILDAIGPDFHDRRKAFVSFGFTPDMPAPTEEDMALACGNCQPCIDEIKGPACLLDKRGYFLTWNAQFPMLLRMSSTILSNRIKSRNPTLIEALVNPDLKLMDHLENAEDYLPYMIQGFRLDTGLHEEENWYPELIERLMRYERFAYHWNRLIQAPISEVDMRQQHILWFRMSPQRTLGFRLIMNPVIRDERFGVIHFVPADEYTKEQCGHWYTEMTKHVQRRYES